MTRDEAIAELKRYSYAKKMLLTINDDLAEAENAKYSIGGAALSSHPTSPDASRYERKLVNAIYNFDELRKRATEALITVRAVEAAMNSMPPEEKAVIRYCYVERDPYSAWYIRAEIEMHRSRSELYRIRDRAIEDYMNFRK